ncbi:MAG: hypothetical protein QOI21_5992 [Actinomycetota bacterium]|nr:hypothetical protein [Actinomycetota bacterium]
MVRREKRGRWALVAVVTTLLIAVPLVVSAALPRGERADPGQLRALIARSDGQPYSGYAESSGQLGLPDMPNLADVTSLLNGTTRIRAWYVSPSLSRVDVLTTGSERSVYHGPEGDFTWDYAANMLTQLIGEPSVRLPRAGDLLPPELARRILAAAPGDPVTTLEPRRIAGIAAPGIRLTPANPDTTLGQIDIWADPGSGLPVRVEVTARGQAAPILVTAFQEVDLKTPDLPATNPVRAPSTGFTVVSAPDVADALGALGQVRLPAQLAGRQLRPGDFGGLYGSGLGSFFAVVLPRGFGGVATDAAGKAGATTIQLPGGTAVAQSIPPLSLVVVRSTVSRRWYLLAGLVRPAVLEIAAQELSTLPRSGR